MALEVEVQQNIHVSAIVQAATDLH
jgi:hypothetical protein